MSSYSSTTRSTAARAEEAADWTAETGTLVALGMSAAGEALVTTWLLFVAGAFKFVSRVSGRIATDPPRDDFYRATFVMAERFDTEALPVLDAVQEAARRASHSAERASAQLQAGLVAFERWQGARTKNQPQHARDRASEAWGHTRSGGSALVEAASELEALRDRLAERFDARLVDLYGSGQFRASAGIEQLPNETLALLFVGGLRPDDARELLVSAREAAVMPDPRAQLLRAAGRLRELGKHLGEWDAPMLQPYL